MTTYQMTISCCFTFVIHKIFNWTVYRERERDISALNFANLKQLNLCSNSLNQNINWIDHAAAELVLYLFLQ